MQTRPAPARPGGRAPARIETCGVQVRALIVEQYPLLLPVASMISASFGAPTSATCAHVRAQGQRPSRRLPEGRKPANQTMLTVVADLRRRWSALESCACTLQALIGSANLTGRALDTNIECGVLLRGGPQPRAISEHIWGLVRSGVLTVLPN